MLKEIIDPSRPIDRSPPENEEQLFIAAKYSEVLAFDNLSGLNKRLCDALCRLLTGSAFTKRTAYSNTSETHLEYCRPVFLNGIDSFAERADLLDRSVFFFLPIIKQRRELEEMEKLFKELLPDIRYSLFILLSKTLRHLPEVTTGESPPRMIFFYRFLMAMDIALGFSDFRISEHYKQNIHIAFDKMIDEDVITTSIVELVQRKLDHEGPFHLSAYELFQELRSSQAGAQFEKFIPEKPKVCGNQLTRMIPLLASKGVTVERKNTAVKKGYIFRKSETFSPR